MWSLEKAFRGTFQHITKGDCIFCMVELILFIKCFLGKFVSRTRVVLMLKLVVLTRISKEKKISGTVILYLQVGVRQKFLEERVVCFILECYCIQQMIIECLLG